jgi:hypothetical protein
MKLFVGITLLLVAGALLVTASVVDEADSPEELLAKLRKKGSL